MAHSFQKLKGSLVNGLFAPRRGRWWAPPFCQAPRWFPCSCVPSPRRRRLASCHSFSNFLNQKSWVKRGRPLNIFGTATLLFASSWNFPNLSLFQSFSFSQSKMQKNESGERTLFGSSVNADSRVGRRRRSCTAFTVLSDGDERVCLIIQALLSSDLLWGLKNVQIYLVWSERIGFWDAVREAEVFGQQ